MSLFSPVAQRESQPYQRPIAATIAVVLREGYVLLVRRANMPDAGKWGFPGGKIENGETINDAVVRELLEETRVIAKPLRVLTAVDAFDHDEQGRLRSHYILIAVLCEWHTGTPVAGDDALEAQWFSLEELEEADLALSMDVASVARLGVAIASRECKE
ncbi:NUDIX hydrolase [Rhizobium oryzicola]|uniref:NUDIX hydrolase n=1 Tax=Rhizobium oryzicola TaxID=1232668 RepID=A0ABT8T488_9HYPH|nr:NUDIX hydrolase [Rhizobium oryzicola]MDO1585448.1 NUDIX hydrolase [Rhizobium oryzicola]